MRENKICYLDDLGRLKVFPNGGAGCDGSGDSGRRCARNKFDLTNFIKRKRHRKKTGN